LIKINLVREGRAVRGAGATTGAPVAAAGGSSLNNILIVAGVVLGALIAAGWWFVESNKLAEKKGLVASKTVEAQKLEKIIKQVEGYQKQKESLQKRIDVINQLKQNQKGPVRLMDRVSQDLPDLVWLDKMSIGGGVVTIDGRGLNPNAIANFVENVKNDPMFEEPDLGNVTQISTTPLVYSYTMNFHFSYAPKGDAAATGTAATGTANGTAGSTAGVAPSTSTVSKR
jgi:Tfp pilus assembly protein PilN